MPLTCVASLAPRSYLISAFLTPELQYKQSSIFLKVSLEGSTSRALRQTQGIYIMLYYVNESQGE